MKVAYVFALPRAASYKLGRMILPNSKPAPTASR